MVVVMVLLTIVVFIAVDVLSRIGLQRYREARQRKARAEALQVGLRLDYTDEAPWASCAGATTTSSSPT